MKAWASSRGKSGKRKSWAEKVASAPPPVVKPVPVDIAGMKAGETMLVPSPALIAAFITRMPFGSGMDVKALRRQLAREFQAEVTCPITTGFHLRAVAEAAYEALGDGAAIDTITPFWRVVDEASPTAAKLACGIEFIRTQRQREGL
ncbi:MAG: hypothetical protein J0H01_03515 [Rhizobiales bacterium]|nr:hypothetical protein [Hyphomicrobiales bacterium]